MSPKRVKSKSPARRGSVVYKPTRESTGPLAVSHSHVEITRPLEAAGVLSSLTGWTEPLAVAGVLSVCTFVAHEWALQFDVDRELPPAAREALSIIPILSLSYSLFDLACRTVQP
jgi:hypothetical protein